MDGGVEELMRDAFPKPQPNWALFLDVDGTLVPNAPTPAAVVVADDLPALLERLHDELGNALALVSGRSIADLDRLFAPARLPAAGQHGAELRSTGDDVPRRAARCPALAPA